METLVDIQHWLYRSIGEGLGNVAGGDYRAVMVAMAAAILFGAVHALMPGHGKIVLISYHLGQPSRPAQRRSATDPKRTFEMHLVTLFIEMRQIQSRQAPQQ